LALRPWKALRRRGAAQAIVSCVVLIVGAAISVGSFLIIRYNVETEAKLRFERHASDAQHVIAARIHSYADVMYGLRSLYSASYPVTRMEFQQLCDGLDLHAGTPDSGPSTTPSTFP